ncbi:MAG: type II toxin-antitoxin system HicB family antitoxin [Lachnospiraceae bacterium]|jgi:predicted RNase H-like HicB family nuclease|nr:type II toxin-antitoxin system HicB family antitoxin [Lachnospiraceae bacterium]
MKRIYPAIFHEEEGSYWVEFPDLEGCQTTGDTLENAIEMAQEALGLYINHLLEEKLEIPNPSDIRNIHGKTSDIISYVCTDDIKYRRDTRAIKKTLSIPAWLAAEAEERNLSLSRVLQEALMLKIGT